MGKKQNLLFTSWNKNATKGKITPAIKTGPQKIPKAARRACLRHSIGIRVANALSTSPWKCPETISNTVYETPKVFMTQQKSK